MMTSAGLRCEPERTVDLFRSKVGQVFTARVCSAQPTNVAILPAFYTVPPGWVTGLLRTGHGQVIIVHGNTPVFVFSA